MSYEPPLLTLDANLTYSVEDSMAPFLPEIFLCTMPRLAKDYFVVIDSYYLPYLTMAMNCISGQRSSLFIDR